MRTITKKEIVSTLRSLDATRICALYKRIHGTIPTDKRKAHVSQETFTCLDGFKVYQWARRFATSERMERNLFRLLDNVSHHWNSSHYAHAKHGAYAPLPRQRVVEYLLEQCQDPVSNYAKRPMMGHTHLYFCSPTYGHRDYNKWCALPIAGNEHFCEAVINYANRYFN